MRPVDFWGCWNRVLIRVLEVLWAKLEGPKIYYSSREKGSSSSDKHSLWKGSLDLEKLGLKSTMPIIREKTRTLIQFCMCKNRSKWATSYYMQSNKWFVVDFSANMMHTESCASAYAFNLSYQLNLYVRTSNQLLPVWHSQDSCCRAGASSWNACARTSTISFASYEQPRMQENIRRAYLTSVQRWTVVLHDIYVHVCVRVYVHASMHMYTHMYAFMHMLIYIYIYV